MENKTLPDPAAHPGLVSLLSLSHSPTPFILRVPLDPAGAGPQQGSPLYVLCMFIYVYETKYITEYITYKIYKYKL